MKPKDVRVLHVTCDHSEQGKWRVHLLEEEWQALCESYDRIFQDRYNLLTVHTKEGMLASEWVMRAATAERERDELREALEEREADMHARIRAGYDQTIADSWRAKVAEVERERDEALYDRDALHKALRDTLDALGNGSAATAGASVGFMLNTPNEVREVVNDLRRDRDDYKAKLDAELPAAWREDVESLNLINERLCRERDEARERCALAEQRALDAECERDACRGMEQAAELRAERLFRDRQTVDERARKAAQLLIAEVGAQGPMNVDEAADKAVQEIKRLKRDYDRIADAMGLADWAEGQGICHVAPVEDVIDAAREYQRLKSEVERLRWGNDMACENTPTAGCECPGCETARSRAERGEAGPSEWEYRCESCGVALADVEVNGVKLPRVERCDCCLPKRTEKP